MPAGLALGSQVQLHQLTGLECQLGVPVCQGQPAFLQAFNNLLQVGSDGIPILNGIQFQLFLARTSHSLALRFGVARPEAA